MEKLLIIDDKMGDFHFLNILLSGTNLIYFSLMVKLLNVEIKFIFKYITFKIRLHLP